MSGIKTYAALLAAGMLIGAGATAIISHGQAQTKTLKTEVKTQAAATVQIQHARATEARQTAATTAAETKIVASTARIHAQTEEIIRHAPDHITPDTVHRYPLSNGFVRVVDAAITGDVPGLAASAAEPDDGASTVAADRAALTLSSDFGTCRQAIEDRKAWQAWAISAGLATAPKADSAEAP